MNPPAQFRDSTIRFYDQHVQDYVEATFKLDMSSLYAPFISLLPPNAHILDAGCGPGRDSLFFLRKGYRVTAFDASEKMVEKASQLTGLAVLQLQFQHVSFEMTFDGIWACATLLHVPESEMNDVFFRLGRALKPNGAFYLSFKYGNQEEIRSDRLFSDYDEEKFQTLLEFHPYFKVETMWKAPDLRAERKDEYWLNVILRKLR